MHAHVHHTLTRPHTLQALIRGMVVDLDVHMCRAQSDQVSASIAHQTHALATYTGAPTNDVITAIDQAIKEVE